MSKKIDWNMHYTPFGSRSANKPKYSSFKEYLAKGYEMEAEHRKQQEFLAKAKPALEALLKCRMEDGTPLVVNKPFHYMASELVTEYDKVWNDSEGGWVDDKDSPRGSYFMDVQKSLPNGTELTLKSMDPHLQEFIFVNQNNQEVVIPYQAKELLMLNTNVYESVINFMNQKGD